MMTTGKILAYILWVVLSAVAIVWANLTTEEEEFWSFFSPKYIYEHLHVNIIGAILGSITCFVIAPVYCCVATVVWFFYWLCTVGRK